MSIGRLAGGTLLAPGLAATPCVGTDWTAEGMQSDLADQARATPEAHHQPATVTFSGRDAYVWADTPSNRADAIATVKTPPGVRIVESGEGASPGTFLASAPPENPSVRPTATRTTPPASTARAAALRAAVTMTQES